MKTRQITENDKVEKRNFRGKKLRGRSFRGKELSEADFSDADIRGADFTNAILIDANFEGAKAGLQRRWVVGIVISALLLSFISGAFSRFPAQLIQLIFPYKEYIPEDYLVRPTAGWLSFVIFTGFYSAILYRGVGAGIYVITIIICLLIVGAIFFIFAGAGDFIVDIIRELGRVGDGSGATVGSLTTVVATSIANAIAVTTTGYVATRNMAIVATFAALIGAAAPLLIYITVGSRAAGFLVSRLYFDKAFGGFEQYLIIAIIITLVNICIGWRSLNGNKNYSFIRTIAIAFAAVGGTSFRNANLTNANFTNATLKSTDFRGAILNGVRWHQAKKLDRVRPGNTYLQHEQVRNLLTTTQGQDQNFDRQDLRGVNLRGANLVDASFIATDLSGANLQYADLSRAKLVQTQLDQTNLMGAILTGAFIEDWGITNCTNLYEVRCKYIFMRLPTKEDPNPRRKPDNFKEEFEDGDFADFIKPIVDTLDLYHNQNVDPRAVAISFKRLAENNPDAELEIVAMEKRGEGKFKIKAKTASSANHSELSTEYFTTYNQIKLFLKDHGELLSNNDRRTQQLINMVSTLLERPNFYAETLQLQGDIFMSETFQNDFKGANIANFANKNQDNARQQANQYNYGSEEKKTLAEAAEEIQSLLKQLEETNPNATEAEKKAYVSESIPPSRKERFIAALKAGGTETLREVLDNPYVNIGIAIVEGWQNLG